MTQQSFGFENSLIRKLLKPKSVHMVLSKVAPPPAFYYWIRFGHGACHRESKLPFAKIAGFPFPSFGDCNTT